MENSAILPNRLYSIRASSKLLPWISCESLFQRLIHSDIDNNDGKEFKTIIITRGKSKRYFIKGQTILELLTSHKNNE